MSDHIEHKCGNCGSYLHHADKCPKPHIDRKKLFKKEAERIICSAIWYKDFPLLNNDIPNDLVRPKNCDRGIVFSGQRHPHCLYQMVAITGKSQHEAGEEIQGFLTSENRFVDRKEAGQIHIDNGGKLSYSSTELYSEDLY